ncbi:MAG: TIGR02300 family protein [Methyloligellaceae bacterium]
MSKVARGTKRVCKSCSGKFYDLSREPIVCPLCGSTYEAEEPVPEPPKKPVRPVAKDPVVEAPKKEEAAEETVATPAPKEGEPEIVSLEEAQAEEEGLPLSEDEEAIADLPDDDDADIPAAEGEDDTFLEQDDEAEPDVEEIIGSPLKPDQEP